MKSFENLADDYIVEQRKLYHRNLQSFTRAYIKGFARFLEKRVTTAPISGSPVKSSLGISNGRRVALITEEIGSMTGGRYYAWFIALALVEMGYDVTIYTTQTPSYFEFFRDYKLPAVQIVDSKPALENLDVEADIYISSPLLGNLAVTKLSEKYKKPCFVMVFDPLPMMQKFTTPYTGWEESIKRIRATDVNLITLCNSTTQYTYEWLNKKPEQVFPIYPCINSKELAKSPEREREDYVVFISRLVKHKKFEDVLEAVKATGVKLKVISSVIGVSQTRMVKQMKLQDKVEFLTHVDDKRKFEILRGALAVINGSNFEGFGMWAAEAVATGTPLVCYELPTIVEIRDYSKAENFYLAEFGNSKDLTVKLQQALTEKKFVKPSSVFDFSAMINALSKLFNYEPKIGVVMCALNEEQFISSSLHAVIQHPSIKKVAVIEGAVELYPTATKGGWSVDKTQEQIAKTMKMKHGEKIIYERYGWAKDKSELRNRGLELLRNVDYILVVDADEVWSQRELDKLVKGIKENPQADIIRFKFYHFYKSITQVATGGQWDSMLFRCFRYIDKSLHWKDHEKSVVNGNGVSLDEGTSAVLEDVHVHHLGYMKTDERVVEKLQYYKARDTHLKVDENIFLNWKKGKPTSATHGTGDVKKFDGEYPEEILSYYNLLQ